MPDRAVATFTITSWDQMPYDETPGGPYLARATVGKAFEGDLEGESTARVLLCQAGPEDIRAGAGYVASERFVGRVGTRSGSFVLQHGGLGGPETEPYTFGHVVPGSGTGALMGLTGRVEIRQEDGRHTLVLDYDLG